jgi:hypothetical protein
VLMAIARGHITFKTPDGCHASGEMDFEESERGEGMKSNRMDAVTVSGNQAIITGSGRLADGTPVNYTAVVVGKAMRQSSARTPSRLAGSLRPVRCCRLRDR